MHYRTLSAPTQHNLAECNYLERFTFIPVIFADESAVRPTFIFNCKQHPYRIVNKNGYEIKKTLSECLSVNSLVFMWEDGVEWTNIFSYIGLDSLLRSSNIYRQETEMSCSSMTHIVFI